MTIDGLSLLLNAILLITFTENREKSLEAINVCVMFFNNFLGKVDTLDIEKTQLFDVQTFLRF